MPAKVLSGGDKLTAALREIGLNLEKAGTLRVGFLEGATYPDGTSVPMVAAINEFGAPSRGQPPRPFFRRAIAKYSPGWGESVKTALQVSKFDTEKALGLVGAEIKGQIQQSIVDFTDPPLAQGTIDRKGFKKPLIDTGHMLNSVDFEVE